MKTVTLIAFIIATCKFTLAQTTVSGIVVDSTSMMALPDVNIAIKHTASGTATDAEGKFTLTVNRHDTLRFTRIGYHAVSIVIDSPDQELIIRMTEKETVLRPVTLSSGIEIPRLEVPKETIWKHPHIDAGNGIVNVFGPGVTIPFHKLFKDKKKNSVKRLLKENELVRTYVSVITNPETKQNLRARYTLSEEAYYETLVLFNEVNSGTMYTLTEIELLTALDNFFSSHAPR